MRKFWLCKIWRFHDWTSAVQQGKELTPEQIADPIKGFNEYSKMYCNRCGHESKLNIK